MAIIMVYHELVARDSADVSWAWKWYALGLLALIVVVSIVDICAMHMLSVSFSNKCFVGVLVSFNSSRLRPFRDDRLIDVSRTVWGKVADCDHIRFVPVLMATCACMWFVVFAVCGHGGRGNNE